MGTVGHLQSLCPTDNLLSNESAKQNRETLLVPMALVILMTLAIGFMPIPFDPDLWFHLADGDYILSHRSVPQADPYSFTRPGALWVPQSWLFDLFAALSWRHLGPRTTEGIMAAVYMVTMVISFALLTARRMNPFVAAMICTGLAVAAGNTRGVRPQVFTLLLCNVIIFLLVGHRYRPRRRLLLYFPLIFLVWAQVHSACVMGLLVAGVWLLGRGLAAPAGRSAASHRRELLIGFGALALSIPAVLITPHRITHFHYIALTMKLEQLKRTTEWRMPRLLTFDIPDMYIYLLLAGLVVLLVRRSRRIGRAEISLCAALILLGLTGVRHIPLACIASVPLIADALARREGFSPKTARASARSAAVLALLSTGLFAGLWRYPIDIQSRYAREEPVNGVRQLTALDRPLRLFTTYNTGSYILWANPEHLRVFVDSRADVYGDELLAEAHRAMNGEGWERTFRRWRVDGAVVQRWNRLAGILTEHDGWRLLAEDPKALTFLRNDVHAAQNAGGE